MELKECREALDRIDEDILRLFVERMRVCEDVAAYKKEKKLPVLDAGREREKLLRILEKSPEELGEYAVSLYTLLMDLSRSRQHQILGTASELTDEIQHAIEHTPKIFPSTATVACQGVEGAYSQLACENLFRLPNTFYFASFGAVFTAIENGLCQYGVIPVENSTAGSVNAVYDLMRKHNFKIVRSVRLKVDHNLLVKPGVKLEDIREIYSHQQAISQCSGFLQKMGGVKVIPCANTAVAAKMVSQSERRDIAALSSRPCMRLYGLESLADAVQDQPNNYTRFICISKDLEIYPGANRTSLMLIPPDNKAPGALYKVLARLFALGINLIKLESRPLPERNFEFMFYFDLDMPVYSPKFIQLMGELDAMCETFTYLGSYSEVI